MSVDIKITANRKEDVLRELDSKLRNGLEACGIAGEGFAKVKCPVDTGRLKNSITHEVRGTSAIIGTNVEYGKFVELGTSRRKPKPYLRPAVTDHVSTYKQLLTRALME